MAKKEFFGKLADELDANGQNSKWGSFQYGPAYTFFKVWQEFRTAYHREEVLEGFGIQLSHTGERDFVGTLVEVVEEEFDYNDRRSIGALKRTKSVEGILGWMERRGWDLWCAAPFVLRCCLKDMKIGPSGELDPNPLFESETLTAGLACALLVDFGFVKDPKCFSGFDT